MGKIITNKELWNLPNEQIASFTIGRCVKIVMKDGDSKEINVKALSVAANPPHLFCGFITSDNHNVSLGSIEYVELI